MILAPVAAIDTNILVSSLLAPRGNEARVIAMVYAEQIQPATSAATIEEYRAVLSRAKFNFSQAKVVEILRVFSRRGVYVTPSRALSVSPHEADNRFLECAEAARADFLITGNLRHFPESHGPTRILNARAFLDLVPLHPSQADR